MKMKTQDPRIAQKVIEMVAKHHKITPDELKDEKGNQVARQIVMYILKEELGSPLRISREAVNVKSDPSVYTASKAVKSMLKTDTALASLVEEIKTETLMITAMPNGGNSTPIPVNPSHQPTTRVQKLPVVPERSEATQVIPSDSTAHTIAHVQKAVTGVFLGVDLLQSPDPAAEVMLAKDAVVFLVWDDFPKIPLLEIVNAFHLNQDDLHRSIGRISVCLKEDGGELKKKLKAARAMYLPA